jgi:DNA helicase-2/ATP-dependent DNA helicase PcrA
MNFNESQQTAILHRDGPMLVLAGPGSGKTATLTQRTIHLTEDCGINPSSILVITFTRAAAQEMKQRFLAGTKQSSTPVTFGTFHAVFFMVLKYAYHFTAENVIPEEQRYRIMRELLSYHHLEYRDENEFIGEIFGEIGRVKNERIPLEHFYSSCCGEDVFRKIYTGYNKRLSQSRLIDFDDMLVYTYELFRERPDILSAWQKKYTYILIDEFQDINPIQWEIMKLMAAPQNNLFVVGDDDQAIYRFRGAKPEIMLGFKKDYPDAAIVNLDVNYRCTPPIVDAAGRLIACNEARYKKEVRAAKTGGKPIRFLQFEDEQKEGAFLVEEIAKARAAGEELSRIAVLFRTNTQPRLLMERLISANLPFTAKDKIPNIYDHWIARDFFAYLRIAQGSDKRADFLSILNKPNRYISRSSLTEPQVVFDEWIKLYDEQPWVAERIEKLWYDTKQLNRMSPYAALNYIRRGIGYDDYLADYAEYRRINKEDLYEVADELLASAKGYRTLEEWYAHIDEYREELKRQEGKRREPRDGVTLSTLHSAKGLEFSHVYLIDANEGVTPYKKAVLLPDVEEERRLFYVGMTRASERLTICSVRTMRSHPAEPSRFIREAGYRLSDKN